MVRATLLDLNTDYLISSLGQTSATGLSVMLDTTISHDAVTRFLNQSDHESKVLWKKAIFSQGYPTLLARSM